MKNLAITLFIAVATICGIVALNCMTNTCVENDNLAAIILDGNDLSLDNAATIRDIQFDKDGNFVSMTTYKWNNKTNSRGAKIEERLARAK